MPQKFKIDMRINRLSAHVRSNKITREKALLILNTKENINNELLDYFKERLNLSDTEYNRVINLKPKYWYEFKTYKKIFEKLKFLFKILENKRLVPTSFYLKYCFPYKIKK